MKKFIYLFLAAGVLLATSCVKPSEKAKGTYSGSYTPTGLSTGIAGTADVVAAGDEAVNVTMACPTLSISAIAASTTVKMNGDKVDFTFSSSTTTALQATALTGTLTGSSLSFSYAINTIGTGTFLGAK